jgi:hypothetical protein
MNRINPTEPATFLNCRFGLSVGTRIFLYFIATSALFVPFGGFKKSPCTFNQRLYITDP